MRLHHVAVCLIFLGITSLDCTSEQYPTFSTTGRVFQIRVGSETGSSFTIERGDRQYLITARHLVKSLPVKNATVEISVGGLWKSLNVDIIYPPNIAVDIAVLKLSADLSSRYDNEIGGSVTLGQGCYFLGFPYQLYSVALGQHQPFEKHAYLSAIDNLDASAVIFYLDGFNNPGFSGGPVVFYDYKRSKWMIVAVISGYRSTEAQARVGRNFVNTNILVNSGIVITYSVQHAVDAIDTALASK